MKLAAARKSSVAAIDLGVDTSTPTGKLVADVMMSVAEWEREVIGERPSAACKPPSARASTWAGCMWLTLRATHTLAGTGVRPNAEGLTTASGAPWSANTAAKVQKRIEAALQELAADVSHSDCRTGMVESARVGGRHLRAHRQ